MHDVLTWILMFLYASLSEVSRLYTLNSLGIVQLLKEPIWSIKLSY